MTPESIQQGIQSRTIGCVVTCVDRCESTNDLAWRAGLEGAPHGATFFAEEQTRGRGRWGRTWVAPRGGALLCSILLRPQIDADRCPLVVALGALAVTDVAARFGVEAEVRFPNDVVVGERKLAGILVESRFISARPDLFVLGIGLNVNDQPPDLPATSLAMESREKVNRILVARALLEAVEEWAGRLDGSVTPFQKAWRARSNLLGRRVRILQDGAAYCGTVSEVDCLEGVELRLATGHQRLFRGEHIERLEIMES